MPEERGSLKLLFGLVRLRIVARFWSIQRCCLLQRNAGRVAVHMRLGCVTFGSTVVRFEFKNVPDPKRPFTE